MSRDSLVRIEFKLDCIIRALQDKGLMLRDLPSIEGINSDSCPVCESAIKVVADFESETPIYRCGCRLPITIVPGIYALIPARDTNGIERPKEEVSSDPPPAGDRDR